MQAVKLLARYLENPAALKDEAVLTLGEWMAGSQGSDSTVQLVAALIYQREDLMNEAMSSPQKGRGAAAPADSPNKSPEGNANNGLLGLDEDTLAFLMDSKNFE